jgi:hypothetical protein
LHSAPATAQALYPGTASRTTAWVTLSHRLYPVGVICPGASLTTPAAVCGVDVAMVFSAAIVHSPAKTWTFKWISGLACAPS